MINVAVAGLGWWGRHISSLLSGGAMGMTLATTVDPNPAASAATTSFDEVLADGSIDAVILCTPNSLHPDQVETAARAGKHVFCEKPLALTADGARRAVAACREAGVVLGIGHERRFDAPMVELRRMVVADELGTILHAQASMHHDRFKALAADNWRGSPHDAPGAGMTAMGVHLTDGIIALLGPIITVHALVRRRSLPLPSGDVVSVNLGLQSGATAHVSAVSATPNYGTFTIFGDKAWAEIRDLAHPESGSPGRLSVCREGDVLSECEFGPTESVRLNLAAFADAVQGRAPYPFSDEQMVHNVAVLEAIVRSAETGHVVEV